MVRVAKRKEENDGQTFHIAGGQFVGQGRDRGFVQRGHHVAVGVQPFGHGAPPRRRDQRRRARLAQMIEVGPVLTTDDQHIGKPIRGEQRGLGPATLQQRIGRHGHPVDDLGVVDPQFGQPGHDGRALVGGRGRDFMHANSPVRPHDKIGKRPADINAN